MVRDQWLFIADGGIRRENGWVKKFDEGKIGSDEIRPSNEVGRVISLYLETTKTPE